MATVFDAFKTETFEYLELSRGIVYGNVITASRTVTGIFKERNGMTSTGGAEAETSSATAHVRPEDFEGLQASDLVGNGIRRQGVVYSIIGSTEGRNFENGNPEHWTLTLEWAADIQQTEDTTI